MSNPTTVLDAAMELTDDQRAALALRLIESLDGPADSNVEEAWMEEVSRRVTDIRAGVARTIPASEVRKRVRSRLSKTNG
jgi:putative addiction module component (TIGR02574 family)